MTHSFPTVAQFHDIHIKIIYKRFIKHVKIQSDFQLQWL